MSERDFPRDHATNPCLHCAIGELVFWRNKRGVQEDAFMIAKGMIESVADMCASWEGAERRELVEHARRMFDHMLGEVERNQWKSDNARPEQAH